MNGLGAPIEPAEVVMTGPLIVAIDGPAASGKGTLAAGWPTRWASPLLDTGLALPRGRRAACSRPAATRRTPRKRWPPPRRSRAGELDAARLRGEDVGQAASMVAAFPAVREALLAFQRRFAGTGGEGAVLDGRDIGTVVFPDAAVKLFVTATPEARARRRSESCAAAAAGLYTATSCTIERA